MQDRVSKYPGRVKMTLPDGTSQYVTLERADEPVQVGTPLNKASLLTDATAALFGLGPAATVNDMLSALAASVTDKAKIATGSYTGTGLYGTNYKNSISFPFTPQLVIIAGYYSVVVLLRPLSGVSIVWGEVLMKIIASWGDKSLSWYADGNYPRAKHQLNEDGLPYYYVAIA